MRNSRRGMTARQPLGPRRGRADLKHLRAMSEAEIRKTAPPELANLPRDFWKAAKLGMPPHRDDGVENGCENRCEVQRPSHRRQGIGRT